MEFIKFATIVLVIYGVYFTVNILIDLTKQKRKSLAMATSNNTASFQAEHPKDVKQLEDNRPDLIQQDISTAALEINEEKKEEAKRVLHDIGVEPYGTNGLSVNPDNLMTVIKNSQ